MIKNIVFDMGRVLIVFDPARIIGEVSQDPFVVKRLYEEIFLSVEWQRCDRGDMTQEEMADVICLRLPEELREYARRVIHGWADTLPLIPGMEALVRDIKSAGYRIYLLSNTCANFHTFRRLIPALQYFDGEFISADWHLLKPEAEIFRAFYYHFGLNPSECFFLDDAPANIEAAARTGMSGYVFLGDADAARMRLELVLGRKLIHSAPDFVTN